MRQHSGYTSVTLYNGALLLLQGIVKALTEYSHQLLENRVRIFVRRGGPNYQEGLKLMREVGEKDRTLIHTLSVEYSLYPCCASI